MKKMRKWCILPMCIVLAMCLQTAVLAAGSVTYTKGAEKFIFAPGSEHSLTDLFSDFKNVMPGDQISQEILIKNDRSTGVNIEVYLRSLGAREGTEDFLSQLSLTVKQNGDSVLFAAPTNETAQLGEWVYLGMIYSGGEITLDVTLDVPITMGNEFQKQIGYIDWEFMVEEIPSSPSDPQPGDGVDTGDSNEWGLYVGLMAVSLAAIVILFFVYKERNKSAEND